MLTWKSVEKGGRSAAIGFVGFVVAKTILLCMLYSKSAGLWQLVKCFSVHS